MSPGRRVSFIVRTVHDERGQLSGVIERVATGAKEAFTGMDAIGRVIARMLDGDRLPPSPDAPPGSEPPGVRPQAGRRSP